MFYGNTILIYLRCEEKAGNKKYYYSFIGQSLFEFSFMEKIKNLISIVDTYNGMQYISEPIAITRRYYI